MLVKPPRDGTAAKTRGAPAEWHGNLRNGGDNEYDSPRLGRSQTQLNLGASRFYPVYCSNMSQVTSHAGSHTFRRTIRSKGFTFCEKIRFDRWGLTLNCESDSQFRVRPHYDSVELVWGFRIRKVANAGQYDLHSVGDALLKNAGYRVEIRQIVLAYDNQGLRPNLAQALGRRMERGGPTG